MNVKKIILYPFAAIGAIATIGFASIAIAANGERCGVHTNPEKLVDRMAHHLDLNDEQKTKLQPIFEAKKETMQNHVEAMKANREAMQNLNPTASNYADEVAKLAVERGDIVEQKTIDRANTRAQIAAILTPEQREEFETHLQKRMKKTRHFKNKLERYDY